MVTLGEAVAGVQKELAAAGVPSPMADAHLLVAHVLGVDRPGLARRIVLREQLDDAGLASLAELTARRAAREPLQHLTGTAPFRTIEILVGPGVFVPRAETELSAGVAIEEARRLVEAGRDPLVVDLCSGSGAIAFAVAVEVPTARVVSLELSTEAVGWARRTLAALEAEHEGLEGRVDVRAGDATGVDAVVDLLGAADVVTANPPYIPPDAEPVEPEVRDHDPALALYGGGTDGLEVPRAVVATAAALLRPGGLFVMEHGEAQGAATRAIAGGPGWEGAVTQVDLTGRDRALVVRRAPTVARSSGGPGTP
ncbi:peptide chain release factor N(5)-glutamine methyltransferase [Spongisporangium articulatum]|uniref:peptide chain release factor N(5)-glutamine methyltransferase n=1 Tax=Spongisporangium articulatum TaxID=3362603 RepID=A0ABW8ATH2_9ACTN